MTGGLSLSIVEQPRPSQKLQGTARVLGPKWSHLPTLTIGMLGVQIFWSVEMGYASPYLLSLGLTKSAMSLVFLAGPLSGLIVQPFIGVLADNSTSRFGRRRPYMLLGTFICVFAMLLLGYTRSVAALFTGWGNKSNDTLTIILAVLSIYLIDFAINAVQALDRALLVDTLPPASQAAGNAWAALMLGSGAVVGFFVGTIPLPSLLPFLGTSQIQILSAIVSLLLLVGHVIMAVCVKERVLQKRGDDSLGTSPPKPSNAFIREIREIWANIITLPRVIRQICIIQFFAWIAWFPLLFYTTMYIGDLYRRATPLSPMPSSSHLTTTQLRAVIYRARDTEATRLGSKALFYSALLALLINSVAPAFVATAATRGVSRDRSRISESDNIEDGVSDDLGDEIGSARPDGVGWKYRSRPEGARGWLQVPEVMKVNMASLWAISHLVLGLCMLGTLFTDSVGGATILISITGFSWAITQWAPFSLLAEAILTEPDPTAPDPGSIRLTDTRTPTRVPGGEAENDVFLSGEHSDSESESGDATLNQNGVLGNFAARTSRIHVGSDRDDGEWVDEEHWEQEEGSRERGNGLSAKAGIILGIHNVFIVIPQFLVTGLSSIIFAMLDPVPTPGSGALIPPPPVATNVTSTLKDGAANITEEFKRQAIKVTNVLVRDLVNTEAERSERGGQSNSVVYIFRLGGISAMVAFILCWRLAREMRHK